MFTLNSLALVGMLGTPGSVELTLICYRISWSNPWQPIPLPSP